MFWSFMKSSMTSWDAASMATESHKDTLQKHEKNARWYRNHILSTHWSLGNSASFKKFEIYCFLLPKSCLWSNPSKPWFEYVKWNFIVNEISFYIFTRVSMRISHVIDLARLGKKPLSKPITHMIPDTILHHYATMSPQKVLIVNRSNITLSLQWMVILHDKTSSKIYQDKVTLRLFQQTCVTFIMLWNMYYISVMFCLSHCFIVSNITEIGIYGFWWNFQDRLKTIQGTSV